MNLPQKIGSFTLIRELSDDGVASTFLGILDEPAGKEVQIRKVLGHVTKDPSQLTRIRLRIGDLLHLSHPYLQPVHDFKLIQSAFYLIEQHSNEVRISDLLKWMRAANIRIPPNLYLYFLVNLCTALEALHATAGRDTRTPNILHRALCPDAISVSRQGGVLLGGFGLVDSPPGLQHALGSSHELRNLEYLSPEQTQTDAKLTPASDIFSLASVAYELLTGNPLFRQSTQLKTIHAIRKAEVSLALSQVKNILPGLDKVLFRALSLNPRHRYQRAFVLREDIRALMANFTFSNVQNDWATFLKPMLNRDERISTFPDAFGPTPADSDDTNAILRASLNADLLEDTSSHLAFDSTDVSGNKLKQPTAETFAFLSPSSADVPPPEAFQGFSAEITGRTAPVTGEISAAAPEDVPMPMAVERTHPEIRRALQEDASHTTWVAMGPTSTKRESSSEETTAEAASAPKAKATDTTGPVQRPTNNQPRKRDVLADQPDRLAVHARAEENTTRSLESTTITAEVTFPLPRNPDTTDRQNTTWVAAGAITAFAIVVVLGVVAIVSVLIVFFGTQQQVNSTPLSPPIASADTEPTAEPTTETTVSEQVDAPSTTSQRTKPVKPSNTASSNASGAPPKTSASRSTQPRTISAPAGTSGPRPVSKPAEPELLFDSSFEDEPVAAADLFEGSEEDSFDLGIASARAQIGELTESERQNLRQTAKKSPEFSRAYTVLYSDAKARKDLTQQRIYMEALMTLPENERNPMLLVEKAHIEIKRKAYSDALKSANLADRHWARLPSKAIFNRRAMIFEAQAAAWQGKFYESGGEDMMACHRAIQAWNRYKEHVSKRNRSDLSLIAETNLRRLEELQKRVGSP